MIKRLWTVYLIGAVSVWIGLFAAAALLLGGTPHFGQMLPVLFLGAVYFVVIAPGGILSIIARPAQPRRLHAGSGH